MRIPISVLSLGLGLGLGLGCGGGTMGPDGLPGPPGAANQGTPALVRIFPYTSLSGNTLDVDISGGGTHFTAGSTTVTFDDPGITASSVKVTNAALLTANVVIADTAQVGKHTVTVTTPKGGSNPAAEALKIVGIFTISSPLAGVAGVLDAATQPGALLNFDVENLIADDRPFAGTPALTTGRILNYALQSSVLSGVAVVNALVPAGPLPLSFALTSGTKTVSYAMDPADPTTPVVTARKPTMLTPGTPLVGENFAAGPNPTNLYQLSTTANNQIMVLTVQNTGGGLLGTGLYGVAAPSSGQFSQGQFFTTSRLSQTLTSVAYLPTMGAQYLSIFPGRFVGGAGMDYTLSVQTAAAMQFSTSGGETDSPTMPVASVTLSQPAYSLDGAIKTTFNIDYVKITTPKAGNLYVFVGVPGMGATNVTYTPQPAPIVSLYGADCTSNLVPQSFVQVQMAVTANATYCAHIEHQGTVITPMAYQILISQDL